MPSNSNSKSAYHDYRQGPTARSEQARNSFDWPRYSSGTPPRGDQRGQGQSSWPKPEVFRGNVDGRGNGVYSPYYTPPVYMDKFDHLGTGSSPYDMNGGVAYKTNGTGAASIPDSDRDGDNSGTPSRGISRLFSKFADRCSVNGVPFIKASKNPIVKFAWSFLLVAATGGMVFHLYSLITTFFSYGTHSQIELTFSELQFPAVTICNVNAMRFTKRWNASEELNELIDAVDPSRMKQLVNSWEPQRTTQPGYFKDDTKEDGESEENDFDVEAEFKEDNFMDDISLGIGNLSMRDDSREYFKENLGDSWEAQSEKSSFYQAEEKFREFYAAIDSPTRAYLGHQISDMLIQCSFAGGKCKQRNFTRVQSSTFGNCYTIEYPKFVSRRSGPSDGMDLVLYIETGEYVPGITNGQGLQVVIHERGTVAFPEDEGIAVKSGSQTMIGLRMQEISRLGDPYGVCASTDAFFKKYGVKYTRTTCQKTCEQVLIREQCQCYDEIRQEMNSMLKIPAGLKPCRTRKQMSCIARMGLNSQNSCDCGNPCSEIKYVKTISNRQWPSVSFAEVLRDLLCRENASTCRYLRNRTHAQLQEEFVQLKIFYEDLNFEQLSQQADYEVDQFLSDIGGILGLWIGLSVLSMFEIVNLLVDIVVYVCCGRWKKKDHTGQKYRER